MNSLTLGRATSAGALFATGLAGALGGSKLAVMVSVAALLVMGLGLAARSFPLVGIGQAIVLAGGIATAVGPGAALATLLATGLLGFAAGELARVSIQLRRRPGAARLGRGVFAPAVQDSMFLALVATAASVVASVLAGGSGVAGWFLPLGLLALAGLVALLRFVVALPPPRR